MVKGTVLNSGLLQALESFGEPSAPSPVQQPQVNPARTSKGVQVPFLYIYIYIYAHICIYISVYIDRTHIHTEVNIYR